MTQASGAKSLFLFLAMSVAPFTAGAQKTYQLASPDGKLKATVEVDKDIRFSLMHEETPVLSPSVIRLELTDGTILGDRPKVRKVSKASVDAVIPTPFYKKSEVKEQYNETSLTFQGNYQVIFRLYDDGMAYRFATQRKDSLYIKNEGASYRFAQDHKAIVPYVNGGGGKSFEQQFFSGFENVYTTASLTQLDSKRLMFLPLLVELDGGKKLCITEADLDRYPGMFLHSTAEAPALTGIFATYPKQTETTRTRVLVKQREDYIAKTEGTRNFPWRAFIVANHDAELADNDMVYKLAEPSRIGDASWLKPGKVAWEWWSQANLYGVDFRAGMNTETYKYYIDFAAANRLDYVIIDGGWYDYGTQDLFTPMPALDVPEVVAYGKRKNVGIVLWMGYPALQKNLEKTVKHYADLGVKGFKIDYMDRDDQIVTGFLYEMADLCARHHLFVDYHGTSKPAGLQRTYPNVLNFEGVSGLEQLKWAPRSMDMVTYDVTIPFIRMVAGPMDYTPGAMRNAIRQNYAPVYSEPMSQGTRCRQLATYIVFEAPLNMLSDRPSNYNREAECLHFMAAVPTVWDETKVLNGRVGEYIALARRTGDTWYVGGLTNWEARDMELDLSFVEGNGHRIELFRDGINADRAARDYRKEVIRLPADKKLKVHLAPGGGFALRIYR